MSDIKLLVADDESTVRSFFKILISKEHLPVASLAEAENGLEAVRLAKELNPDLLFLDIRMPGLDGLQAAEMILKENPAAHIVIVSAYNEFEYARTAFRAGVDDYLLKPVKPAEVADIIRSTAERRRRKADADAAQAVKTPALVRLVYDYVVQNLARPFQLKDIAQAVFVSSYHLSRTFKQLTGQSITDYIQEQRLLKAEEILLTTDRSITEVAGMVGFNDAAYFATCFKNKTGISPLQYRKKQDIKNK